jgi:hypothetical protein
MATEDNVGGDGRPLLGCGGGGGVESTRRSSSVDPSIVQ